MLLLAGLIVCYTASLLAVYLIPDEWVNDHVQSAVTILKEEGDGGYANYFWHVAYGITDNLTDKEMFLGMLKNGAQRLRPRCAPTIRAIGMATP